MAADTTITRAAGTVDVDVGAVVDEDINKEKDIKTPHINMEYPHNMERISMACNSPTFMQTKPTSPTTKSTSKTGITVGAMDMMSRTIITAGIVQPPHQDMCIGQLGITHAAAAKRQSTKLKCDGEGRVVALLTKLILYD